MEISMYGRTDPSCKNIETDKQNKQTHRKPWGNTSEGIEIPSDSSIKIASEI
jgi:hypothetical protein